MPDTLIANTARFSHETIDDETVLIDNESGHLLLISGIGSFIWEWLAAGATAESIRAEASIRYGASAGEACRTFLQSLVDAGLAVVAAAPASPADGREWPAEFTAPLLERYDDISTIIAMDPIHDVDQSAGWPRVRSDSDA